MGTVGNPMGTLTINLPLPLSSIYPFPFPPSAVCAPKRAQSFNFAKLSKAKLSFAPKRAKLRANAQKRRA